MEKIILIILMCILNKLVVMVNHFKIQILIYNKMTYNFKNLTNFYKINIRATSNNVFCTLLDNNKKKTFNLVIIYVF
jgi:hypothetical protein